MEIIKGKIAGAKKVVVYGPEGIGKSTFASRFPDPVFIDTEGSTKDMDVSRFPKATSWAIFHKHRASHPYHQHGRANTLRQAVRSIRGHDRWQMNGRKW